MPLHLAAGIVVASVMSHTSLQVIPTAANPDNVEKTTQKELIRKFLEMSPQERIGIGNRLKSAGYQVGGLTGQATKDLRNAYLKAYDDLNQEIPDWSATRL
jgi:hypothetical protein